MYAVTTEQLPSITYSDISSDFQWYMLIVIVSPAACPEFPTLSENNLIDFLVSKADRFCYEGRTKL